MIAGASRSRPPNAPRRRSPRTAVLAAIALCAYGGAAPAAAAWFGALFAGTPPSTLGARDGRLAPCPERPNCVSSSGGDAGHATAPFAFRGEPAAAMAKLAAVLHAQRDAVVDARRPGYLHAEFASAVMGFVDDVEFVVDPAAGVIHVRSAARLGYYDFGVNRRRVDALRAAFAAATP